jgi:hypothetical protein
MIPPAVHRTGNVRLIVVIVLTVAAVLLYYFDAHSAGAVVQRPAQLPPALSAGVQSIVDTMLQRYGIPRSSVRTWNVLSVDRKPLRVAQQIEVSRNFPSLIFNDQLQRMLEGIEARVFATERSRDNIVTMHIVRRGQTIRSIAFSLTQGEE